MCRRILVVDDNPAIHHDFRKILLRDDQPAELNCIEDAFFGTCTTTVAASIQFHVDSAFQGQEALEMVGASLVQQQPYALAFVDMRMPPGWDGLKTIEEIWAVDPEIQVVICTAYSDKTWSDVCSRVGQSDNLLILKKPFDNIEVAQLAVALTAKWEKANHARQRQRELEQRVEQLLSQLAECS